MKIARATMGIVFALLLTLTTFGAARADDGWPIPTGWSDRAPHLLFIWLAPPVNGFTPNINVFWQPDHDIADARDASIAQLKALDVPPPSFTDLSCATGKGAQTTYTSTAFSPDKRALTYVVDLVPDGAGGTYLATYTRSADAGADPAALGALDRICKTRRSNAA